MRPFPKDEIDAVRACDDRIGAYSDHEGNEDGPTFHLWQKGIRAFDRHCERAIEDHKAAIRAFRRLRRLNLQKRFEPTEER